MQNIIKFIIKQVQENNQYDIGCLKSLEESLKSSIDYKTYSLVFDLISDLSSLFISSQPSINIAEMILLNLLPKRSQTGMHQIKLFYHQYFN